MLLFLWVSGRVAYSRHKAARISLAGTVTAERSAFDEESASGIGFFFWEEASSAAESI